jgi:hypothetical protein
VHDRRIAQTIGSWDLRSLSGTGPITVVDDNVRETTLCIFWRYISAASVLTHVKHDETAEARSGAGSSTQTTLYDRFGAGRAAPCLAVAAAVESTAMEGSTVEGSMLDVVTVKKAEPKREPYRSSVGERRVRVRIIVV